MSKLVWKIVGRRPLTVDGVPGATGYGATSPGTLQMGAEQVDQVDVEWTCSDGSVQDTVLLPANHPPIHEGMPPLRYEEQDGGTRDVIKDQVNVRHDAPDSIVAMILEEKKKRLADNLGITLT